MASGLNDHLVAWLVAGCVFNLGDFGRKSGQTCAVNPPSKLVGVLQAREEGAHNGIRS